MNDTVSEDVKLLPCPHCGETEHLYRAYRNMGDAAPYAIDCIGCGADFTPREGKDVIAAWNRRAYLAATKPPLAGEVTPVYRVDWENAPRDGTRVLLLSKGTHPDYRVEQRLFWSKHYSIHDLGGCWSDGFVTMSDLDFIGWRFDASPPMPGRGEGFVLVPVEPTAEMREAARGALKDRGQEQVWGADAVAIYRAMLAASRPKEDTHAK
jgi:Lar family restriction alleviation protein